MGAGAQAGALIRPLTGESSSQVHRNVLIYGHVHLKVHVSVRHVHRLTGRFRNKYR